MFYSVDVSDEFKKAKSKFLRHSLIFSLIFALIIIGDVLLVYFASEDFTVNLIISIILTIIFAWGAIYYFVNVYGEINARYRYFKGFESGIKPIEEIVFLKKEDELHYVNGLYVYRLYVKYIENFNEKEKIIYTLEPNLKYENGDKLTITTYQRILIQAEKHS